MAVAAPADKRFRRSHVRPSRRRSPWMARSIAAVRAMTAVVVLCGTGWYGARAMAGSAVLHVSEVRIRGIHHLSRGEVMALLSGLPGEHLLQTDLEAWRRRLLASPWVEQATLRRVLPSAVEVAIVERTPMALGRVRGDLYLIDERGMVIDQFGPNYAQFDLPLVDGLVEAPRNGSATVHPARAALAAALLRELATQPELQQRVSQIDVANEHDAVVLLDGDAALAHLGRERFAERLRRYLELREAIRARVPEIEYVDLRFDGRLYVRPVKGSQVIRAGTCGDDTGSGERDECPE